MRKLADDTAAEQQHAHDKNHPLDDEHPLTNGGQIVFQRDHEERARDRPEQGAQHADQRVMRMTSPDIGQSTSVKEASWKTSALAAPATPANVADNTKATSL